LSWNFRQIRPTVDFDRPLCSAIDFRDQWVAFFGISSSVVTHDRFHLIHADGGRPARPGLVDQAVQPLRQEPAPPLTDGVGGHPQLAGDHDDRWHLRTRTRQHDPRAQGQRLGLRRPPRPPLQHRPLVIRQQQRLQLRAPTRN
jgi:hypothetical protein